MYDVAIIGAGIAGASVAHHCAMQGLRVLVLEQGECVAPKASGNPAGILYPYMASNYDAMTSFYLQGLAHTVSLLQHLDISEKFHSMCGMLHLPKSQGGLEQLQELSIKLGLPEVIMQPHAQGFFMAASGWVNVPAFCAALLQRAEVRFGVNVTQAKYEGGKWFVESSSGEQFVAEHLVIASAYEAQKLLPHHALPMNIIRGQITYLPTEMLENAPNHVLCYGGYLTPAINGVHYIGATFEKGRDDLDVDEAGHQTNISLLQNHLPLASIPLCELKGRAAFRTVSGDRFPIIGAVYDDARLRVQLGEVKYSKREAAELQVPYLPNLYVSLAHGARGLTSAPLAGAFIANKISQLPYNILGSEPQQLLSTSRFALRDWRKGPSSHNLHKINIA